MSTDYKFEGWVGLNPKAAEGNMTWQSYEPKAFQETDVRHTYTIDLPKSHHH